MKKSNIWKYILIGSSITVIVLLITTGFYGIVGLNGSFDPYLYNSVSMISGILFDLVLVLVLLIISLSIIKGIKISYILNYIFMITGVSLLATNIYVFLVYWGHIKATHLYMQAIDTNKFLEKVVVCLILVSLFIGNQNREPDCND
ncbi:hypothetical protein IL308_02735 [Lactococcus lactis]|uniref:hypothetical protein n=1 Tax=Lactococcus lactis TaxID=1358 RepID=UPI0019139536|nr:hypothetical protein [Lactococcus lactis]MBK5075728.1 hypothetical protein [Lactococcus lactis]